MEDNKIAIDVKVSMKNIEASIKAAEDNAWEHAKDAMVSLDMDMGDDEFGIVFTELNKRYTHNIAHLQFFMMTAILLVKTLVESGTISLYQDDEMLTAKEITQRIGNVSGTILNSYMWLAAGYELTWLDNEELPEEIHVTFNVDGKNLIESEEEYEDYTDE